MSARDVLFCCCCFCFVYHLVFFSFSVTLSHSIYTLLFLCHLHNLLNVYFYIVSKHKSEIIKTILLFQVLYVGVSRASRLRERKWVCQWIFSAISYTYKPSKLYVSYLLSLVSVLLCDAVLMLLLTVLHRKRLKFAQIQRLLMFLQFEVENHYGDDFCSRSIAWHLYTHTKKEGERERDLWRK